MNRPDLENADCFPILRRNDHQIPVMREFNVVDWVSLGNGEIRYDTW